MMTAKLINILYHLDQWVLKYNLLLHVLSLISAALNELISKLDRRSAKSEALKCGFKKKAHVVKSPSRLSCLPDAPAWAVVQPAADDATSSSTLINAITDSSSSYSYNSDSDHDVSDSN